jgi:hypothetical protein
MEAAGAGGDGEETTPTEGTRFRGVFAGIDGH